MIPNDPAILLSFVNTKLRDFYSNLDDMCDDMELERKTIEDKLSLIGYKYSEERQSMIDKDLYESILNAFTWEKVREQTNYYYTDKAGILREKRIMVRIRVVGEVAKIQVKLHKNENSPLQICEENEFETEEVPDIINAELAKEITGEDVGELYKMGCAVTIRNSLVHNGSELCLDKTTYFDKTDYEVEVEYEEKISADLLMKLTSLGVRFNEKCVGKFSRFLAEYENQE